VDTLAGSSKNLFSRAIGIVRTFFGIRTYGRVRLRFLKNFFLATHPDKRVFRGALAAIVLEQCKAKGYTLACAESCTGGLIAAALTDISGSSAVFTHGFITYANQAKITMLGVAAEDLEKFGAVSETIARQMAEGARRVSGANMSVATTGIAGPSGGTAQKPVGLVFVAVATSEKSMVEKLYLHGNRQEIRAQAVHHALHMLRGFI
jgi:nicotinamide-nucleotide amidase